MPRLHLCTDCTDAFREGVRAVGLVAHHGSRRTGGIIVTLKGEQPGYAQRLAALGGRAGYVYVSPDRDESTDIAWQPESGQLEIAIDEVLHLDQAAVAHTMGERGHLRGKIVLDVAGQIT